MSASEDVLQKQHRNSRLDALTEPRRRHVLSIVGVQTAPVTERELAARLAAIEREESAERVSSEEIRAVHISLRHVHLPKLDDADLVTWDRTDETVRTTDQPGSDTSRAQRNIVSAYDGRDTDVTTVVNERRRAVLDVLESRNEPMARAALAREVATREANGDPSNEVVDDVGVRLHHVHLPKLDQAGLVDYDVDEGTIV